LPLLYGTSFPHPGGYLFQNFNTAPAIITSNSEIDDERLLIICNIISKATHNEDKKSCK